ncbi:Vsp/OspC family lipoprotein (plasmid) [Borrelia miyamotoi]|uniref:Vsp/OspC family lipoprotein n=1 Tax=Borrelia miyamotoi TaxID=47466 RepID=A0A482CZP1_9SPIR|nr:Vsp/OspC family lipoprotein [Borrelia miyamotoi]ATQ16569.1 Vsp/OspC family lipoprotein [Borrelia miyamotoi]ATQ16676.1 Vsp/OspC family lipoprotein [Borrelia miyamotoi]QBK63747.1 hypothetical protein EZU68_04875 [Borrelia miyamotoi]QBK65061.1 hypothetical protein EZU69_05010 [Borrelia miyamotoi]QBL99254.1 hypothetical protein EZU71_05115 [Borrelia miyamotoi]
MTLFLIINIVMISCGSGGPAPKEGQASKADGTVIDLAKVSKKIKDAVDFAASVKEIETLVKSVDELAKAIGKKIKEDGTLDTLNNKNGSLLAGAFQVILTVETKLKELEKKNGLSDAFKAKITNAKGVNVLELVNKLKGGHAELEALNTAIDELLKAANGAVSSAIAELTISAKAAIPGQS